MSLGDEELLEHLDAVGLSKYDMPEFLLRLDALPLTPSGKIVKRDLAQQVSDGQFQPRPVRFRAKAVS